MKFPALLLVVVATSVFADDKASGVRASVASGQTASPVAAEKQSDPQLKRLEAVAARLQDSLRKAGNQIARLKSEHAKDSAVLELESNWENTGWEPTQNVLTSQKFLKRAHGANGDQEDQRFLASVNTVLLSSGLVLLPGDGDLVTTGALGSRMDLLEGALSPASKEYLALRLQESVHQAYYDGTPILPLDSFALRAFGWETFQQTYPKSVFAEKAKEYADEYFKYLIAGSPDQCLIVGNWKIDTTFSNAWKRVTAQPGNGLRYRMLQDWTGLMSSTGFTWNKRASKWFAQHGFERYCLDE